MIERWENERNFLDIRNHGYARVAVVVPKVAVGDPVQNLAFHRDELQKVRDAGAMYAVCPELGLSSYSCGDLFHNVVTLTASLAALERLLDETRNWNMLISVGMPLAVGDALYNVAVTLHNGIILAVAPKAYPPNYREFYEGRHFAAAGEARVTEIEVLGQRHLPFGTDVLIRAAGAPSFVLHTEVCEDSWVPVPPSAFAALGGATVLANLSASNIVVGKHEFREDLVVHGSAKTVSANLYGAAGFGESSTDLAWDGDAMIAERGTLLAQSERFTLGGTHILADIDLTLLTQERLRQTSFRQNARDHGIPMRSVTITSRLGKETPGGATYRAFRRTLDPHPFVPSDPAQRDERCRETFLIQATAVARRLLALPERLRKLVIGVSGGQDSTHALLVAAHTMDLLRLPRSNIIAVTMPGPGTSAQTKAIAEKLMAATRVTRREVSIMPMVETMFAAINHDPDDHNTTYQNVQAWTRQQTLFAIAADAGGIVLGTGDLSELMLGWCTMFGDHASHYGVNAGVPKTLISYLIRWAADTIFKDDAAVHDALYEQLGMPISPELLPPDAEGRISQKTEDYLGPYELHDFFGYWFVRFGMAPSRIVRMALHAFEGTYTLAQIKGHLHTFLVRFFQTQVKRSVLPDGPKVGLTCISPRGDWRMPSDATPAAWLADLERVPDLDDARQTS